MWKQLGRPAVQMIWEVAQELQQPEAEATLAAAYRDEHHCGFNEGLLVFIPKKPSATDEYGELCFQASDARPICIVDTANRLIANAARLRWESLLASWLAKEQRGFLPGRQSSPDPLRLCSGFP